MKIDLLHNKLIADTLTDSFRTSVFDVLLPMIEAEHGEIDGIQMYEDCISDDFELDGYFYYPLTVIKSDIGFTAWIKWDVSNKALFEGGVPFAYLGDEPLEFSFAEPPENFINAIEGRNIYFEGDCVKLTVDTAVSGDPAFLAGKYSQTFIDEMARQLTAEISKAMSVEGLPDSNVELRLIFAPDTYMEHTCENVTYRRLLITDKGCGSRDFWIKWTRNNSAAAYSISDHVSSEDITFELGEDVHQKIREREYRFLVRADTDKYHYSMGRKNITEWRELIKRAIRRGDLTKVISQIELAEHSSEVHDKLSDILNRFGVPAAQPEDITENYRDEELETVLKIADNAIESGYNGDTSPFDPYSEPERTNENTGSDNGIEDAPKMQDLFSVIDDTESYNDEFVIDCEELSISELDNEPYKLENEEAALEEKPEQASVTLDEYSEFEAPEHEMLDGCSEPEALELAEQELDAIEETQIEEPAEHGSVLEDADDLHVAVEENIGNEPTEAVRIERVVKTIEVPAKVDEERIRAEIEAKLRLEYETAARHRAEQEAFSLKANMDKEREENERLRREQLLLMQENEKLIREREMLELQKAAEIQRRKEEEQRLRDEIEARLKAENRERERLEEAARLAVENQRQRELERLAEQKRKEEEQARKEEEEKRLLEQAKLEEERAREAERIKRDSEPQIKDELAEDKPSPIPAAEIDPASYTYTSKAVTLMFKSLVDPNLIKKIQEIMVETVKKLGKEKVSIRVKAKTVDERTVLLDFLKIPEQELQLLIDIVNTLGKSNIGIVKATVK